MATKKKATAKKKAVAKKAAKKAAVKKKVAPKKKAAVAKKAAVKKKTVKKAAAKKAAVKKGVSKKAVARKAPAKKAAAKKATKKPPAKNAPTRKVPAAEKVGGKGTTLIEEIAPYQEAAGEEYMNEDQKAHFRDLLWAWKRELMEEVDRTVHHMQDEAANFPDPNDRATQESEFSLELRTRDRERKLIKKIDEALDKLDQDEYGYCESCGIEIGIRRLEARPTATLCIDCKTLDEIREKHMGK